MLGKILVYGEQSTAKVLDHHMTLKSKVNANLT